MASKVSKVWTPGTEQVAVVDLSVSSQTGSRHVRRNLHVWEYRLSWGVLPARRREASTRSGVSSLRLLIPSRRMFISNSSCLMSAQDSRVYSGDIYPENLDGSLHSLLSVRREGVKEPSADAYCGGTERQCLEDVTRTPHAAIDEHGEVGIRPGTPSLERCDDVDQVLEARARVIELTAAVVAEHDSLHTCLERQDGVLGRGDALQDNRH